MMMLQVKKYKRRVLKPVSFIICNFAVELSKT